MQSRGFAADVPFERPEGAADAPVERPRGAADAYIESPAHAAAEETLAAARAAQQAWRETPLRERLAVVRCARRAIAARAPFIAELVERRPVAETLTSELLPLLEAMRFLERNAAKILASRRHRRARSPLWLRGVAVDIEREPYGAVVVIAPSNYPLMLPGIQTLQALVAGNAVVVKPAAGGKLVMEAMGSVLASAGLPANVLQVVGESSQEADALCRAAPSKVVFTGSAETGGKVLGRLRSDVIPATLELSGNDAAFVRADADLDAVVAALAFAMKLNGGATCVAPRRVLVPRAMAAELAARLAAALTSSAAVPLSSKVAALAAGLIDDAVTQGARVVCGGIDVDAEGSETRLKPTVLGNVRPGMRINRVELFAPLLAVISVRDDDDALRMAAASPYALGATVFGRDVAAARRFAREIDAGIVVVNDAVVPTADPRAPLSPRGMSGYGVTRGAEGLLDMTRPKAIVSGHGTRPHLTKPAPPAELIAAYIETAYGAGARVRLGGAARVIKLLSRSMSPPGRRYRSADHGSRHGVESA